MPGLADLFRAAVANSRQNASAADAVKGAAAIADTFEAFADERAQLMLVDVLLPWAANVARMAARKWVTRRRRCGFEHGSQRCRLAPIAECIACGRPVCLSHAFVGSDATVVCWPCMRTGASNAKPWGGGVSGGRAPWDHAGYASDEWGSGPQQAAPFDKLKWAYAVLGVEASAGDDEVKAAYKKACYENHPDRAKDPQDAASRAEKFKMVQLAYQVVQQSRGDR